MCVFGGLQGLGMDSGCAWICAFPTALHECVKTLVSYECMFGYTGCMWCKVLPQSFAVKCFICLHVPKHANIDQCGSFSWPWINVQSLELVSMKHTSIGSLCSIGRGWGGRVQC